MKNHVPRGDADDISRTLAALEAGLGDPWEADAPVSHAALMRDDEAAAYPAGAYEALVAQDVNARLVPEALGGKLYSCHESLLYFRSLARRCTTLATVALLPNIGYFAVLIAGTEDQKRRFGTALLHGDAICWGLSEKSYGSDVLSNATRAEPAADGYLISGEKWPIGLADRARMMVVQARTGEGPSPAAHTLLIFDRAEADRRTWAALPNEDLHGVRGLPLGGVRYDRAPVRMENRLGEEGRSLEIVLRAHQILRIGVSSTTLGAVDTGLRIALDFARSRQLFGEPIIGLPVTRRQLADAFADLFLCEILLTGAARALHVAPKRLYLQSSIVKFFIPTTMEAAMQSLSVLIGARYFLRGNFAQGVFQKMLRDAAMASFVDGNTLVNLRVIGSQMPLAFTRIATARENGLAEADRQTLDHLYDPRAPIGEAQWTKLDLQNNGLDLNLVGLADASARLAPGASPATRAALKELQRQLDALVARYDAARAAEGKGFMQSAVFYELAEQYCLLSAAGAAVQYAARAAGAVPEALQQVDWLGYCLGRILRRFDPADTRPDPAATDAMLGALEAMHDAHCAFSTIPHHYAGQPAATSGLEVSRG